MISHLSSSSINLYLRCSLKYKFHYIDELPKPFKSSGLAFGGAVHSSIEWLHKQRMAGKSVSLDTLYRIFHADWYAQRIEKSIHYKAGEDERNLLLMGKEMLGLYFQKEGPKVVGAEVPFTIPLMDVSNGHKLGIPLEGIFDLIEDNDVLVEFKTSNKTINADDPNYYIQLTCYSYAYEMLYQKKPKALKIIGFVKTKKPKMVMKETLRDKKDYVRLYFLAREVLRGIESGIFIPQPSFWCNDCEYSKYCKAWRGN